MLIIKKLSNQYYQLDFRGKDGYDLFTHTVGSLSYKRFNEETGLWETNEAGAHILSDTFHIPYLENIGQDLKLQPFEYQKETISEALSVVLNTEDGGGCLLKLPCGAGRYTFR